MKFWYQAIIMLLLLVATPAPGQSDNYAIYRYGDRIVISFSATWAFDAVKLPVIMTRLWGEQIDCRAAAIEVAGQQFVASAGQNSNFLNFNLQGLATDSLVITPLFKQNTSSENATAQIEFTAVLAKIRKIEKNLAELTSRVAAFQRQNNCFSCHIALPLALAYKTAAARGYKVSSTRIIDLGRDIAAMQLSEGSFHFPEQPDYGKIVTTLSAGAILAMISDFSSEFITSLKKILPLLPGWVDQDGLLKSDFFFRPFFIGQPTAALLEAFLRYTVYLQSAADLESKPDDLLRQRVLQLTRWASTQNSEAIHRRIVIMVGMPFLFQFNHHEMPETIRQLKHLLKNEPEGQRHDIRALAMFLLLRISPDETVELQPVNPAQNLADEIWQCFEQIITFTPRQLPN